MYHRIIPKLSSDLDNAIILNNDCSNYEKLAVVISIQKILQAANKRHYIKPRMKLQVTNHIKEGTRKQSYTGKGLCNKI